VAIDEFVSQKNDCKEHRYIDDRQVYLAAFVIVLEDQERTAKGNYAINIEMTVMELIYGFTPKD
jgi:hypothetical protein